MKDKLEKAFHDHLKDYQESYDPKAWEVVQSQLGAATGAGSTVALKWMLTGLAVGLVAFAAIYFWPTQNKNELVRGTPQSTNQHALPSVTKEDNTQKENISRVESKENTKEIAVSAQESLIVNSNNTQHNITKNSKSVKVPVYSKGTQKDVYSSNDNNDVDSEEVINPTVENPIAVKSEIKYVGGQLSETVICEGETLAITNYSSEKELVRFKNDGKWITLKNGDSYTFRPLSNQIIQFVNKEEQVIAKDFITVNALPTVNFSSKANIYNNGLPIVNCSTIGGNQENFVWSIEGRKSVKKGKEVTFNLFKKGSYKITLQATNDNGCSQQKSEIVTVRNNYNLLAVDAFIPRSSDARTRTFMPYALTVRGVKFYMTIVDPSDNHVVFTSHNENNRWDGIDVSTGKLTPDNKIYIWKVQLENPLPNERSIYVGTIIHN